MTTNYFDYIKETVFKEEFEAYYASLNNPLCKGIVVNKGKLSDSTLLKTSGIKCTQSHIANDSFEILTDNFHASDYALYHGGAFYSQEISASSAVEVLDPQPGELILDACAAPGGKTCQISGRIGSSGCVISNEKDKNRATILANNCIDMGLDNSIVINGDATQLSRHFDAIFDRILVDAPCSGEGMIKKEKETVLKQWSLNYVTEIADLQLAILDDVAQCLKQDGVLVYSTCTFNTIENEGVVSRFLANHSEFCLDTIDVCWGRSGIALNGNEELKKCRRILPMDHGEGHFIARFIKIEGTSAKIPYIKNEKLTKQESTFLKQTIGCEYSYYHHFNNGLIAANQMMIDCKKAKLVKYYTYIGEFATKRFEPSYNLAHSTDLTKSIPTVELTLHQVKQWLKGYPIESNVKGWVIVCYQGCGLSFGKGDGVNIKNKYPKAKRIHYDVI